MLKSAVGRKGLIRSSATITFDGTAAGGSFGVLQVETATVVGTIGAGGAGNATVVTTGATITGSPITTSVAVANNDTATQVAGKIITALQGVTAITDLYTVGGSGANVTLTAKTKVANDSTLNISTANGTCSGLTAAPTSVNTTAGVALLPIPIFTVTGDVYIAAIGGVGVTTPTSAGGGTIALGVTGNTTLFIGATTATNIIGGAAGTRAHWVSTTPTTNGIAFPAATKDIAISNSIIGTVATADITAGSVRVDVYWLPLSANGNVA